MNVEQSEKKLQVNRCCGCKKDSSRLYFVYIVILLSCMHAFPRHLSIETEMDVTERRQTEAVVAAAADCGEQTKLQVVVTRRLHPSRIIIWKALFCLYHHCVLIFDSSECLHSSQSEIVLLPPFSCLVE